MKVNLTMSRAEARHGYLNLSVEDRVDLTGLDGTVEAGEAAEVVAVGPLDYFPPERQGDVLAHWASRLARGGQIAVGVTDLYEVARRLTHGELADADAAGLLFGDGKPRKAATHTADRLADRLARLGLEVLTRRTVGVTGVVTARRAGG